MSEFPNFRHHIILVSSQNVPEFLAAFLPGHHTVHLHALTTPQMAPQGARLGQLWRDRGGFYHELPIKDITRTAIHAALDKALASCQGETCAMNITGGTKLMTIAATSWNGKIPLFYVDTQNRKIVLLEETWRDFPLPDFIDLDALLAIYGFSPSFARPPQTEPLKIQAAQKLARLAATMAGRDALAKLNRHATDAEQFKKEIYVGAPTGDYKQALDICAASGMIAMKQRLLRFTSTDACRWCKGIWLEEYVRHMLEDLARERAIHDLAVATKVATPSLANEVDAMFIRHNRLHVLECKTGKTSASIAAPILYKAHTLHDQIGGLFGRGMLCSVKPLGASDMERARQMRINIASGSDLANLRNHILQWSEK